MTISYLLYFLLFYLPLLFVPFGISPFETPKIIIAVFLILSILITEILKYGRLLIYKFNKVQLFIIGFIFVISFIHLIFSFSIQALLGNIYRLQGVYLLWILLIFSLLSSRFNF